MKTVLLKATSMKTTPLRVGFGLLLALTVCQPAQADKRVEYIHTDALGTPIAVTDQDGNVIERYEYEPYGRQVSGPATDGPGFTGHVEDTATGLVYMQQRYYDPGIGGFLSVDPVTAYSNPVGQFNRYRYANNNPYKYTDPDGRETGTAFKVLNELANGGKPIVPPPRSPDDWLGPAIGYTLTAAIAAPVAVEFYSVALSNPSTVATATELAAEVAGVTGGATLAKSAAKSLAANPFKGKAAKEVAKMLEKKSYIPKGPDPAAGRGTYVNPKTGRSYHIDANHPKPKGAHVGVHRPRDMRDTLNPRDYPMENQ